MKLAWRVVVLSLLLVTSCTLFLLLNHGNSIEPQEVHHVHIHTLYGKQELLRHRRQEPAVTQERSLLSATSTTKTPKWSYEERRTEKPLSVTVPPNVLTSDAVARNVSYQGHKTEQTASTANISTILMTSNSFPVRKQNYKGSERKKSEITVSPFSVSASVGSKAEGYQKHQIKEDAPTKEISSILKAPASTSQKQSKQIHEMKEPKAVHTTNPLTSVTSTTQKHNFQEHKMKEIEIATNLPSSTMASSPTDAPRSPFWKAEDAAVEIVMQTQKPNSKVTRDNIMLTIRTTMSLHQTRLPFMFDTWLSTVNASNVFLVTDGFDEEYIARTEHLDMHYIKVWCGANYSRWSLCCKSGEEMSLMFRPEYLHYDWYCHLDDDIYLIEHNLIKLLSYFDAKKDPVYLGRAGTHWDEPHILDPNQTLIKSKIKSFHFAVGGMYCISRPLLERTRPWLGSGSLFGDVCDQLLEPEDVSVGAIIELLLNERLSRTKLIHPHGLVLRKMVSPATLKSQVAFAYGCGQMCHISSYKHNAVRVPRAKFSRLEDPSRFKSLHCHLHPDVSWCQVPRYTERNQTSVF